MEFLKQWCFCVCISLIIAVIFSVFTPRGRMKSFYKILLSLFVFISFIYPIKDFNINAYEIGDVKLKYEESEEAKVYENAVNKQVKDFLESEGIKGAAVSSEIDVNFENNEAEIKSVRIAIGSVYDKNEVKKKVFEKLGINAEVVGIGE